MTARADSQPHRKLTEGALVSRVCPICGSDVERVFAEASFAPESLDGFAFASRKLPEYMHYRLVECPQCDCLYSSPVPTRDFLENAYQQASFDASDESRFASVTYAGVLRKLLPSLPDWHGALDIGTGDGAFLSQLLELGFDDLVGIEPSAAPVALAPDEVRGFIRQTPFRAADFEPSRFRVITCFQTMEHVDDPLGLCRDAYKLLKPGGVLFLVCHNRRSMSARLMGLKSPIFDIEHLQLFSPTSIRRTLEMAGFASIEVQTLVNRYPIRYWARLAPLPTLLKSRLLEKLNGASVGSIPLSVPVGNLTAIGYKRP